jgi:uncharacterized protein
VTGKSVVLDDRPLTRKTSQRLCYRNCEMNEPIRKLLVSLFISYLWKICTAAGCQICTRNFFLATPSLVSSRLPTNNEILLGSPSTKDPYHQLSAGWWRKPRLHRSVMLYERDSNIFMYPQSEQNSTILLTLSKFDINGTSFDASIFVANVTDTRDNNESPMSLAMISSIGFYKRIISPLLPPACRFVPTCSSYGVQAIQEFGPTKGCVLIAWRILRCSPLGGKGYDPPKWPPVSYTYSSY